MRDLASKLLHYSFITLDAKLLKPLSMNNETSMPKQLYGPVNYRNLRETSPKPQKSIPVFRHSL